ncbi:hypothetical protein DL240_07620 [Lujinxingia litoralis]|uniref:non-specific serine/threonine protein kinase n=2 Tax=Lujinxingia litoralis TaxID=2211119 RepID=A0A328C5K1_9DELT|nr:hypothetical protein DL240_07620 [Lujinxingia litoralis]
MIGRYELLTRLATGGMAELFLARERGLAGLERLVVIKRILPHLADQASFVEMFLREARIVARLSHPNVVQIYELGHEEQTYHIAMEYIHGSTVRELLLMSQSGRVQVPFEVVASIGEQALRGLHAAHELRDLDGQALGLVHRDISPHNLMCTSDGHVKLLDFGVAKTTTATVEATYSGNLKGKFAYLSPEQCLHEDLDRRSDVFAMGIVLWEMSAMRRLFKRRTELEMMQAIIGGDVPRPSRFRPEVPAALEAVILRALSVDRGERYESAETMRQALQEAARVEGLGLGERPVAEYLKEVAGEKLEERRATVAQAFERALTHDERRRLLHMTGSSSRSKSMLGHDDDDLPTVVERPTGVSRSSGGPGQSSRDFGLSGSLDLSLDLDRGREFPASTPVTPETPTNAPVAAEGGVEAARAPRAGRRRLGVALMTVAGVMTAASLWWVWQRPEAVAVSGAPLAIGWAPTVDPEVLHAELLPLHRELERATGRPVPLVITRDYADLADRLTRGEVAAAVLPPMLYVETQRREPEIALLALKEFDGGTSSDALLLVRMNAQITKIADLEGRTFCLVDRYSTSGNFLPRHYLRSQGHEPDRFIGQIHWSGDHFQGMRDLIDGKCDAAATYSGAFLSGAEYDIPTGQIRTLAITGHIPQDTVTAGAEVSPEDRELLRRSLLEFDPRESMGVPSLGDNQRITGFSPASDQAFETLRGVIEAERLEAGQASPDAE